NYRRWSFSSCKMFCRRWHLEHLFIVKLFWLVTGIEPVGRRGWHYSIIARKASSKTGH
ncbi:hypothetical protein PanWU01x14_169310, partial [Parasponia andersonii]